jgi:hypothetical protein
MRIYIYDEQRIYSHFEDVTDLYAPVPKNSVTTEPPATTGAEVAHWNGKEWTVLPERPPLPGSVIYPQFTALEMLDLFTEAEQLAVVSATMAVPAVKLWYDRLIAATFVTYEDPRTESGLQALVDAGLLTALRKAEIVAAMQPT